MHNWTPGQTKIIGNYIGTDITGASTLPNGSHGVEIWNDMFAGGIALVGGAGANEGNLIRGNGGSGVFVDCGYDGNTISRNKIFENAGKEIENSNFECYDIIQPPIISSISTSGGNYDISGSLTCLAYPCTVELFQVDDTSSGVLPDPTEAGGAYAYTAQKAKLPLVRRMSF